MLAYGYAGCYDWAMNTEDAIKRMMKQTRWNSSQLSLAMGKTRNFLSTSFSRKVTPRVDTLAHAADIMGYHLQLTNGEDVIEIDPPAHGD